MLSTDLWDKLWQPMLRAGPSNPRVFDRDAEVRACNTISGSQKEGSAPLTLGTGFSSWLCTSTSDKCLFLCGCLQVLTDRLATCPTARCHVRLQTAAWTGPPEPRQAMRWQREGAERQRSSAPGRGWEPRENFP